MIFSRENESAAGHFTRPLALFITDNHRPAEINRRVYQIAVDLGFRVVFAPWFTLSPGLNRARLCGGVELFPEKYERSLRGWHELAAKLVIPQVELVPARLAAVSAVVAGLPKALTSWLPEVREALKLSRLTVPINPSRNGGEAVLRLHVAVQSFRPLSFRWCFASASSRSSKSKTSKIEDSLNRFFTAAKSEILEQVNDSWRRLWFADVGLREDGTVDKVKTNHGIDWLSNNSSEIVYDFVRDELKTIFDRVSEAETLLLPSPNRLQAFGKVEFLAKNICAKKCLPRLDGAAEILNDREGRDYLVKKVSAAMSGKKPQWVDACDAGISGLQFAVTEEAKNPVILWRVSDKSDLSSLLPPVARMFPTIGSAYCMVDTRFWPRSRFHYLDESLVGPSISQYGNGSRGLLRYLARLISSEPSDEPLSRRFVEPGVGRSYVTDFLRVCGNPEFVDFTTLGIGLTPYSENGYAMVGPYVDGLTSLRRAQHRHRCSLKLESIGCRTARTAAIIELPGVETTMPDRTKAPAAIIVRGFRTLFRVKQLDPCAGLFLSLQHRPHLFAFLMSPAWSPQARMDPFMAREARHFSGSTQSLRRLLGSSAFRVEGNVETRDLPTAVQRRTKTIYWYAPFLLEEVKRRLAIELERDPSDGLGDSEYVSWFADTMGKQLARMRKAQFLHDYHQPGISRYTPSWIYTLCETNVSLLAEFPDLDTGIFLGSDDAHTCDELLITKTELGILRDNYLRFHRKDLHEASMVLGTLAAVVFQRDRSHQEEAIGRFRAAYDTELALRSLSKRRATAAATGGRL